MCFLALMQLKWLIRRLHSTKTMFFSKKYQLVVTNPCQEDWSKMMPINDGRFCDSCSKSVVDYTNMSEKEINERMRNASSHMCGRFRKEQLDKVYTLQPKIQLSSQRRFFQYILTFLLGSKAFVNRAVAQSDTLKTEQTDSLKLTAIADSTSIMDTVAIAQADTANFCADSLVYKWKWDSTIYSAELEFISIENICIISGGFGPMPIVTDEFPLLPAAFDSIKRLVGITPSDKKEIIIKENSLPQKKEPKPPVKKEEPIVAVMPTEIRREWDDSKAE